MFKSKWEDCLQKINHWTNLFTEMKIDIRKLTTGHCDLRTVHMSHHAEIEHLKNKIESLEKALISSIDRMHFLEVKTANQQRTVIHRYETAPKAIGKGRGVLNEKHQ